jgi:hypothetical protein
MVFHVHVGVKAKKCMQDLILTYQHVIRSVESAITRKQHDSWSLGIYMEPTCGCLRIKQANSPVRIVCEEGVLYATNACYV